MSTMTIMTVGALPAHRTVQQTTATQLLRPKDSLPAHLQPTAGTCVIVSNNGAYLAPNVAVGTPASPPHLTNLVTTAAPTILTTSALNNNLAKMKNNNVPSSDAKNGPGARASNKSRPIAPAGAGAGGGRAAEVNDSRCKRRIQFNPTNASLQVAPHQTASVARRNARERNRVKQVNNGFATLRSHIPASVAAALMEQTPTPQERGARSAKDKDAAKKLSKVETLRMAVEYIRSLQQLLAEHGVATSENTAPAVQVKTESMASGSPTGFDAEYDSALPHFNHQLHPHSGIHSLLPGGSLSSPACSDASTSPTPSYVSDGSVGGTSVGGYAAPTSMFGRAPTIPQHQQSSLLSSGAPATTRVPPESPPVHHHVSSTGSPTSTMFHDSYEQTFNPEDEELLDEIYWWQESQ